MKVYIVVSESLPLARGWSEEAFERVYFKEDSARDYCEENSSEEYKFSYFEEEVL